MALSGVSVEIVTTPDPWYIGERIYEFFRQRWTIFLTPRACLPSGFFLQIPDNWQHIDTRNNQIGKRCLAEHIDTKLSRNS